MNKQTFFFFWLSIIGISSHAQENFKISVFVKTNYSFPSIENSNNQTVNIPISGITGFTNSISNIGSVSRSSTGRIGYDIGGNFSVSLGEKMSFSSGLGLFHVRYNETSSIANNETSPIESFIIDLNGDVIVNNNGTPLFAPINNNSPISNNQGLDYSLTYLKLPVTSSYLLIKKLSFNIGIDFSYLLKSRREHDQYVSNFNQDFDRGDFNIDTPSEPFDITDYFLNSGNNFERVRTDDTSGDGLNNLMVGIVGGFEYLLFKKISITADYSRSLSSIYKESNTLFTNDYKAKSNTISFGVAYHLK